jgi:hypothetical protein
MDRTHLIHRWNLARYICKQLLHLSYSERTDPNTARNSIFPRLYASLPALLAHLTTTNGTMYQIEIDVSQSTFFETTLDRALYRCKAVIELEFGGVEDL